MSVANRHENRPQSHAETPQRDEHAQPRDEAQWRSRERGDRRSSARESILRSGYFDSPAKRSLRVVVDRRSPEAELRNDAAQEQVHLRRTPRSASIARRLINR